MNESFTSVESTIKIVYGTIAESSMLQKIWCLLDINKKGPIEKLELLGLTYFETCIINTETN